MLDQTTRGPGTKCHSCDQSEHWNRDCPQEAQQKSKPCKPCPSCGDNHWRSECPRGPLSARAQITGVPWKELLGPGALHGGSPEPTVCWKPGASGKSGKLRQLTKKLFHFLRDPGATFSVLLSTPGRLSRCSLKIRGVSGKLMTTFSSQPLRCMWRELILPHSFLIMPESLTPLLGRDIITVVESIVPPAPGKIDSRVGFGELVDVIGCGGWGSENSSPPLPTTRGDSIPPSLPRKRAGV